MALQPPFAERTPRASFGSNQSDSPRYSAPEFKVPQPPGAHYSATDESRSADEERARLRQAYESNGWLPGPAPSSETVKARKRAIISLGLFQEDEKEGERMKVLAKYAQIAQQVRLWRGWADLDLQNYSRFCIDL